MHAHARDGMRMCMCMCERAVHVDRDDGKMERAWAWASGMWNVQCAMWNVEWGMCERAAHVDRDG